MNEHSAQRRLLEALRGYVVAYEESARALPVQMGLPTSDGLALGEIMWAERQGTPLSPAQLSARIALTSGATTALIDRLEERNMVTRTRISADRRIVTLLSTESAREQAAELLDPAADALTAALADYDDRTLDSIREFLERFAAILPKPKPKPKPKP